MLHIAVIVAVYALRFAIKYFQQLSKKEVKPLEFISDKLQKLVIVVATVFSIAGNWYLRNLTRLKIDLLQNSGQAGISEGDPQGITLDSALFIFRAISNSFLQIPLMLLILITLSVTVYFLITAKKLVFFKKKWFILVLGLANFLILTIYHMDQSNKDTRYLVYLYPSIVALIAICVEFLINLKKNKIGSIFTICFFWYFYD